MNSKNAVIFDGDGDGTSAAAIWLMDKPGKYIPITNQQKNDRKLVQKIFNEKNYQKLSNIGIFDIDAEQNIDALNALPKNLNVDFIDHHTKNPSIIPSHINNLTQLDNRNNCTATISYKIAKQKGILDEYWKLEKATQLATLGLANDGKNSASKNFGKEILLENDIRHLIEYGKALNFGSATGKMDSAKILKGLVKSESPLNYLIHSEQPNQLIEERKNAINSLENNSEIEERDGIILYKLPSETEWDKELSVIGYNEFMNSRMSEEPSKIHIGLIETPEGKYTFSTRNGKGKAYDLANKIAQLYGKTALGRETAAGFATEQKVNKENLLEKILEARK